MELATLIGNQMRCANAVVAGTTLLPVTPNTTVALNQFDNITIYDGLSSEVAQVASTTAPGASSILLLAPLQFNHAQYTPCSSPGVLGDLGATILRAGAEADNITKQSLWATTQTETIRIPTMRATFDNQGILTFRTLQYPISSINSIALGAAQGQFTTYDATQCFIDVNEIVTVPVLTTTGGQAGWPIWGYADRTTNMYLQVNYTAGYTSATLPSDVQDASILLTSMILARRYNPVGAAELSQGHQTAVFTMRGDLSGELLNYKQAKIILDKYTLRTF